MDNFFALLFAFLWNFVKPLFWMRSRAGWCIYLYPGANCISLTRAYKLCVCSYLYRIFCPARRWTRCFVACKRGPTCLLYSGMFQRVQLQNRHRSLQRNSNTWHTHTHTWTRFVSNWLAKFDCSPGMLLFIISWVLGMGRRGEDGGIIDSTYYYRD